MKRIFIPVLLSMTLLVFGFGQEQQKKNHFGVGFETIFNLLSAGVALNITPAIGKKLVFDLTIAYSPILASENTTNYYSVSVAPLFQIYANSKLHLYLGPGFKMQFTSGGYLEETDTTPILFLKGLVEFDLNGSCGMRAGLSQNLILHNVADNKLIYMATGIEWGFYWRF